MVEAPSFIVPYIYEKPPKEKFEDFSKAVRDIMEKKDKEEREKRKQEREERRQKRKEEKKAKKQKKKRRSSGGEDVDDGAVDDDDDEDFEGAEEGGSGSESDGSKEEDDDVVAVFDESLFARKRSPKENFFEGTLGKFVVDLGMNLVEEVVQSDLLKQQIKRSQKDKSAGVMHAIRSLKASLEKSKEHNAPFKMELQKCSFCSFKSESELVMQHHLETPHMKNMMYRCNFCKYDTRMPQEVMAHMQNEHAVRARLERAPAIHQCPQCPFEDNMKGKLSRHMKVGEIEAIRHPRIEFPDNHYVICTSRLSFHLILVQPFCRAAKSGTCRDGTSCRRTTGSRRPRYPSPRRRSSSDTAR